MYHRCQDWDGSRAFFESLADWLSNIGDSMLADYISATPVPKAADAARIILDALSNSPALIVIDDYNGVEGATKVIDEFVKKKNLTIETLSFYGHPVFIKKP